MSATSATLAGTNYRKILMAVGLVYIIYHLATLVYSPLPWFDEVDYAGVTHYWQKYGQLGEEARNIDWKVKQVDLAYGPGYFIIQSFMTGLFGFSMFVFRFTNLFFGLLSLFLLYRVCRQLKFTPQATLAALLLVAFDPQFNQFLHSGRMDFIATSCFMMAYLLYTGARNYTNYKYLGASAIAGLLLGYAYLTTPRIMFTFPVFAAYFLYELWEGRFRNAGKLVLKNIAVAVLFLAVFEIWVLYQFGTVGNYVYQVFTNSPIVKQHVGAHGGITYNYNFFMHVLALACLALLVVTRKAKEQPGVILFAGPALVCFLFLVAGGLSGRYYGVVVPFVTIAVVGATVQAFGSRLAAVPAYVILAGFVAVFLFKGVYVLGTLPQRDPVKYEQEFARVIPDKSTVGGDFQYYYFARHRNWKYQFLEENGWMDTVSDYFEKNKYDYFIIHKNNGMKGWYEAHFLKDYTIVDTVQDEANPFFHKLLAKLPYRIQEGYGAYVYRYNGLPKQ